MLREGIQYFLLNDISGIIISVTIYDRFAVDL